MKVLRIHSAARKRDGVRVHVDGQDPLELALEVVERSGIREGIELGSAEVARLREDDTKWRLRQAALRLLSYRSRTERELRVRLRAKGFPPALVEWCLHRLREQELLDDQAFASAHVRHRIRLRPRGRSKLREELRRKGVVAHVADEAITEAFLEEETSDEGAGPGGGPQVGRAWGPSRRKGPHGRPFLRGARKDSTPTLRLLEPQRLRPRRHPLRLCGGRREGGRHLTGGS